MKHKMKFLFFTIVFVLITQISFAIDFDLGGGYNRLLDDKMKSAGGMFNLDFGGTTFRIGTGVNAWMYSIKDSNLGATGNYKLYDAKFFARINLGTLYFRLGPAMRFTSLKVNNSTTSLSAGGYHGSLGLIFPNFITKLGFFLEADFYSTFKFNDKTIAGIAGIRF